MKIAKASQACKTADSEYQAACEKLREIHVVWMKDMHNACDVIPLKSRFLIFRRSKNWKKLVLTMLEMLYGLLQMQSRQDASRKTKYEFFFYIHNSHISLWKKFERLLRTAAQLTILKVSSEAKEQAKQSLLRWNTKIFMTLAHQHHQFLHQRTVLVHCHHLLQLHLVQHQLQAEV